MGRGGADEADVFTSFEVEAVFADFSRDGREFLDEGFDTFGANKGDFVLTAFVAHDFAIIGAPEAKGGDHEGGIGAEFIQ